MQTSKRNTIGIVALMVAAHVHAQPNPSKPERPTITKAYAQLFGISLVCDELDAKKTGATRKAFIEHVVVPSARLNDKFAPGGEIRNFVENPPPKMLSDTQAMIKAALPAKLQELRVVCADYERSAKTLAVSINSFVDVAQGDLTTPPSFLGTPSAPLSEKKAADEEEEDDGPIPDVFPSRAAFQTRVSMLWATGTACIDPEREKYKSVIELWHTKLAPKIVKNTDPDFAKSFSRFKGPEDPLYEINRVKAVIPGIAEDCKALKGNVEKLIAAQVP
jgi:hypothetical protein